MKLMIAVLGAALLAACGGKPKPIVQMKGLAPTNITSKDNREIRVFCPGCKQQIDAATVTKCPDEKNCATPILLDSEYVCGSCRGTGNCSACSMMEQEKGKCYNCRGLGYINYLGKAPACPNCVDKEKGIGNGKCPVCKGEAKCDYCGGSGKVSADAIKKKALKPESAAPSAKE